MQIDDDVSLCIIIVMKVKEEEAGQHTVPIIGLEPTRPGYQAWVHTVIWFGQNCAPRPGRLKTNYRYCITNLL